MAERIPAEGGDRVKRFKQVTAGRLVYAVCYPRSDRRDTTQARAEKAKMSSAAQDRLNRRHSWEKLEPLIEDLAWTTEAYLIAMDGETEMTVDWTALYGELPPGSYRLGKSVMDFRDTGDYDQKGYYACFALA